MKNSILVVHPDAIDMQNPYEDLNYDNLLKFLNN